MVTLHASAPARSRLAVAFACDDRYLPFALCAADRITALSPRRPFDICICHGEAPVAIPASLGHLGLRLCRIDAGGAFDGLRLDAGRTPDVYLRLALPRAFGGEYDRVLYLDADVAVQGGCFAALLGVDLLGHPVGAVRDNTQWRAPARRPAPFRRLGLPAAPYFNAGVLLMDVARCEAVDLLGRCTALGRREAGRLARHDQALLNAVLRGDWAELSPDWNWQYGRASRLFAEMRLPHVLHFIGPRKPWADPEGRLPPRHAAGFAAFLARHFPDRPPLAVGRGPAPDDPFARAMLWRHLLAAGRTARYLARFPTDLTVHG